MNSSVPWNEAGLPPELQQAAREAARRAGMSVDQWLKSAINEQGSVSARSPRQGSSLGGRIADLSQRIAGLGRGSVRPEPAPDAARDEIVDRTTARLGSMAARLNERLEQLSTGRRPSGGIEHRVETVDHELSSVHHAPPIAPGPGSFGIDQAIAEIAARQLALEDSPALAPAAPPQPAARPEPPFTADYSTEFASLQAQLREITDQIQGLRRPCGVEDAVGALRRDLAEIARTVEEAMPRRAIETLQAEVRALATRIDHSYSRGEDPNALAAIEQSLGEVRDQIRVMMPAEGLASFEAQLNDLSRKIDHFASSSQDPDTLRYLEATITEMRELSARVASQDAVSALASDVHRLVARVDHISEATSGSGLDSLAERVNLLTRALDDRGTERLAMPQNLESLVQALSDKIDSNTTQRNDQAAFDHLEQQIGRLADRFEVADARFGSLGSIERGIQQLMTQVTAAREEAAATAERVARSVAADLAGSQPPATIDVSAFKNDLAALQASQSTSDQRTQDTLEAVHDTLERLVDRLAMVESDMRKDAAAVVAERAREAAPVAAPTAAPVMPVLTPAQPAPKPSPLRAERKPIDPDLPADTPLEPGTASRARTPAERIAASEAALAPLKREGAAEVTGKANFIAAARRAAQAANEGATTEPPRAEEHGDEPTPTSLIGRFLANRRRALVIGVSILLVLYGTMQLVGMYGASEENRGEAPRAAHSQVAPSESRKIATQAPSQAPAEVPTVKVPSQAAVPPPPDMLIAPAPPATAPATQAARDVTGSLPRPGNPTAIAPNPPQVPASDAAPLPVASASVSIDKLPASIAGPGLRAAVAAGDPAADYEIGVRYAEGRGVPASLELAVPWFERAATKGLAPALYRVGSLYEKGQGVKKDLEKARQFYMAAAEKGNAKAIHNLAVLYAEGIDGKPDYRNASQWFRKAADRGIADSQYNLGILYARGIGVDQNLAESYKWFALAAQQGDQDAGKKRDDVASRLDQQSLVAARLAVQTWAADPQSDEAMNVKAPPGGWDRAPAAKSEPTARRKTGT